MIPFHFILLSPRSFKCHFLKDFPAKFCMHLLSHPSNLYLKPILTICHYHNSNNEAPVYIVCLWSSQHDFIACLTEHCVTYRSKDMSVHVSTCTSYNFDILTPVMWKLWRWVEVCVSACLRKNEWLVLEQRRVRCSSALAENHTMETYWGAEA